MATQPEQPAADRPAPATPGRLKQPIPGGRMLTPDQFQQFVAEGGTAIPTTEVANQQEAQQVAKSLDPAPPPTNIPPPQNPGEINIEDLPPDKRAEALADIEAATRTLAEMSSVKVAGENPPPSTDRAKPPSPPPSPPSDTATEGEEEELQTRARICPNCGWNQAQANVVEVTDEDKQMFLRHILSGDRFLKRYEMCDGEVIFELRSRRVLEQDLIINQVHLDQQQGGVLATELFVQYLRYCLCASLSKIIYKNGSVKTFPEIVANVDGKQVRQWTNVEMLKTESLNDIGVCNRMQFSNWSNALFGMAIDSMQRFDALVNRLQIMARDEDFFTESGGPP